MPTVLVVKVHVLVLTTADICFVLKIIHLVASEHKYNLTKVHYKLAKCDGIPAELKRAHHY